MLRAGTNPKLGVVIPHFNTDSHYARACMFQFMRELLRYRGHVELVAVDDGSFASQGSLRSSRHWRAGGLVDATSPLIEMVDKYLGMYQVELKETWFDRASVVVTEVPGVGTATTARVREANPDDRKDFTILRQSNQGKARAFRNGAQLLSGDCKAIHLSDDDTHIGLGATVKTHFSRLAGYVARRPSRRQLAGIAVPVRASFSSVSWRDRAMWNPESFLQHYKFAPALAIAADRFYALMYIALAPLASNGWNIWMPGAASFYNYDVLMKRNALNEPGPLEGLANMNPRSGEDWKLAKMVLEDGYALTFDESAIAYTAPPLTHKQLLLQMYRWFLDYFDVVTEVEQLMFAVGEPRRADDLRAIGHKFWNMPVAQWAREDFDQGERGVFDTRLGSTPERFAHMTDKEFAEAVEVNMAYVVMMLGELREDPASDAYRYTQARILESQIAKMAYVAEIHLTERGISENGAAR